MRSATKRPAAPPFGLAVLAVGAWHGKPVHAIPVTPPISIPRSGDGSRAIPRGKFDFTPTSASWLNAVEGFFAILTNRFLKRSVFRSVADLQNRYQSFP